MNDNTGGGAFPRNVDSHSVMGMTLRDYFAAKAMNALILREGQDALVVSDIAFTAYQYADAMLKTRLEE